MRKENVSSWDQLYLYWIYTKLAIQAIMLRVILHIPVHGTKVANDIHIATKTHLTNIQVWDWIWTLCTYKAWERKCHSATLDYLKKAKLHSDAPNPVLYKLDRSECRLLDYMRPGRPLVLNFGSCT